MKKLDIEQAEPIRKKFASDWEIRKGKYLYKKVAFDDYNQALRFFMVIEKPQIKLDHFADIGFFYNEVVLIVYTHDVGGLTQLDFELALHIDKALEQMGARQLEENFAKSAKEDLLSYKKIIGLAKKAYETNELEPYFYDAVKITFNMNLYKKYPKLLSTLLKVGRKVSKDDWPYIVKDIKKNTGIDLEAHITENFAEQKAHDAIFQEILVDLLQKKYPDAEFDYQGDKVISADGKLTVIADLQVEDGYGGVWVWDVDTGPYKGVLGTAIKQATAELLRQQPDLKPAVFVDGDNQNPEAWQAIANKLNYTLLDENFADGKVKGKSRPGRVKRAGASCKGSVTALRKRAKNASGEKAKMYHWCANMKSGRKK